MRIIDKRIIIEMGNGNVQDARERTTPSEIFVTGVKAGTAEWNYIGAEQYTTEDRR